MAVAACAIINRVNVQHGGVVFGKMDLQLRGC